MPAKTSRSGFRTLRFEGHVMRTTYGDPSHYGLPAGPVPEDLFTQIGKAILCVAAGDGAITAKERAYSLGHAKALGASAKQLEIQRTFDPRGKKLEEYFTPELKRMAKPILYDAIRVARADGFTQEERDVAIRGAKRLGLDPSIVPQIEALLAVEDGVRAARISIIAPPEAWNAPGPTSAANATENDWWRNEQFGITGPIPVQAAVNVGKCILTIAGGDGELSETELAWFFGMSQAFGAPPDVIEELMKFDPQGARLEDVFDVHTRPMARLILLDSVRCAASDGFAEKERQLAHRAAKLLGQPADLVPWIEGVIQLEEATRQARLRLLSPG